MSLDWKLKQPGRVENEKQTNTRLREEANKQHDLAARVKTAFDRHRSKAADGESKKENATDAPRSTLSKNTAAQPSPLAKGPAKNQSPIAQHNTAAPRTDAAAKPSTSSPPSSASLVYRTPQSDAAPKTPLAQAQALASSQFVPPQAEGKSARFAQLLSTQPLTPPKGKEGMQDPKTQVQDVARQAQQAVAPKVAPPIGADPGARLPNATQKQSEGEVGKKESKNGEARAAKGALGARGADRSSGEQKLEAASSGVTAGGGDEALPVVDRDSGVKVLNAGTKLEIDGSRVLEAASLYNRYVAKIKDPELARTATAVLGEAAEVDQELTEILRRGLAARAVVYGKDLIRG